MEIIKRIPTDIDWDVFVTHPIELIKIDAGLKLKTSDLKTLLHDGKVRKLIDGWSDNVEFEILKQLKLIAEFRNFLQMLSRDMFFFSFPEFYCQEIEATWNQVTQQRFEELMNKEIRISSFFNSDLTLYTKVINDYQTTRKIFRDVIQRTLIKMNLPNTHYIIETILRKVHFTTDGKLYPKFVMKCNHVV